MTKLPILPLSLIGSIIFALFFFRQGLGLNMLLFQVLFLGWLLFASKPDWKQPNITRYGLAWLISSLAVVVVHSRLAMAMNMLTLLMFVGALNYPHARSIFTTIGISLRSFYGAQVHFLTEFSSRLFREEHPFRLLSRYRIFIIPMVIIAFFLFIYRASNPLFDQAMMGIGDFFSARWVSVFNTVSPSLIFTILLGLVFSNFLLRRLQIPILEQVDRGARDDLSDQSDSNKNKTDKLLALKNEVKAAVFLLLVLNMMLCILNLMDIYFVWFNFEWQGEYLKQFVHEGTYLLIISILISIAIVLYFFRGSLNFFSENKLVKKLSYIWLLQNAILVISVGIRNFHYIEHFALAYKRIGVIIFLALTLYGLFTVYSKVRYKKSAFYLFRTNGLALFLVMLIASIVNWDGLIAKYNFNHAEDSFLHLDYLSTLSDKTLHLLDRPLSTLEKVDEVQKARFPFEETFISPSKYHEKIQARKTDFKRRWENQGWLAWNLPESIAYRKLFPR